MTWTASINNPIPESYQNRYIMEELSPYTLQCTCSLQNEQHIQYCTGCSTFKLKIIVDLTAQFGVLRGLQRLQNSDLLVWCACVRVCFCGANARWRNACCELHELLTSAQIAAAFLMSTGAIISAASATSHGLWPSPGARQVGRRQSQIPLIANSAKKPSHTVPAIQTLSISDGSPSSFSPTLLFPLVWHTLRERKTTVWSLSRSGEVTWSTNKWRHFTSAAAAIVPVCLRDVANLDRQYVVTCYFRSLLYHLSRTHVAHITSQVHGLDGQ